MKTPSWIEVNKSRSNHLSDESTTTVIASKLQDRRVISFTDQATKTSELCPGLTPHPEPQPNRLEMADLRGHVLEFCNLSIHSVMFLLVALAVTLPVTSLPSHFPFKREAAP